MWNELGIARVLVARARPDLAVHRSAQSDAESLQSAVALPRVAALDARDSHRLLYETGVWHTEIELASNAQNSQQHIIVNKTFSVLQGVIEANQEPCESLRSAGRSRAEERVAEACA